MAQTAPRLLNALLKHLQDTGVLTDPAIAAAFRAVPRHLFLPGLPLEEVYADEAIPTKLAGGHPISSSSQPSMMAIMLEQLALAPGQRVLEIGAGTGYNAALMAHLVGPTGHVVTLDIDDDLVAAAREHLAEAGVLNVTAVCADGALGYHPSAPYDRIILTVGAWDLAPAWHAQLRPGGRLVVPLAVAGGGQKSLAFEKPLDPRPGDPLLTSTSIRDCAFMRLRGAFAGPEQLVQVSPEPGFSIGTTTDLPVAPATLYQWLTAGGHDVATGLRVSLRDVWQSVGFWVGLNEPAVCDFLATGDLAARSPLPSLVEFTGSRPASLNLGVLTEAGLCLLWLARPGPLTAASDTDPRDLHARTFGPPTRAEVEARLLRHLAAWDAAGRPGSAGLRVTVYPANTPRAPYPGEHVIHKPASTLFVSWPGTLV